jgi:hypothetical protein
VRAVGAIASVQDGPEFRAAKGPLNCRGRVGVLASNGRRPSEADEVVGSELLALFRDRGKTASVVLAEATIRTVDVILGQPRHCSSRHGAPLRAEHAGGGPCYQRYREMRRVKLPGSSRSVEGGELLVSFRERRRYQHRGAAAIARRRPKSVVSN